MKKPKSPPTEEQIADSVRLRNLFSERAGMSQLEFGQAYGVGNQGMVWQYLNADKPKGSVLNVYAAIKFAEGLRCLVSDFSPSIQQEIDRIAKFSSGAKGGNVPNHIERNKATINDMRSKRISDDTKNEDASVSSGYDRATEFYTSYLNAKENKTRAAIDLLLLPGIEQQKLEPVVQYAIISLENVAEQALAGQKINIAAA